MQFRTPTFVAACFILALCLPTLPAQQTPAPKTTATPTVTQPVAAAKSSESNGKSEATISVPSPPAGDVKAGSDNPIKISVNEVIVPVTVTDDKGKFVIDLEQKDFQVFEENKPQNIRFFTRERSQPVVIGFLLDMSTASRIHWENYQNATIELIQNLLTGDPKYSGYLIDYAQDAEVAVDTSSDPDPMVEKVRKLKPGGGSAMYDAIYLACTSRKLVKGEPIEPRRVIVIVGDGHDNASKHSLAQVVELAVRNQVTIYCISTQAFGFVNEGDVNLVKLAVETGGRLFIHWTTLQRY